MAFRCVDYRGAHHSITRKPERDGLTDRRVILCREAKREVIWNETAVISLVGYRVVQVDSDGLQAAQLDDIGRRVASPPLLGRIERGDLIGRQPLDIGQHHDALTLERL